MLFIALVLIAAAIAALVLGALQIRAPFGTIRRLDETEANLARYENWRGKQTGPHADGPTGANEMRAQMRQRAIVWGVVIIVGVTLVVVGLLL